MNARGPTTYTVWSRRNLLTAGFGGSAVVLAGVAGLDLQTRQSSERRCSDERARSRRYLPNRRGRIVPARCRHRRQPRRELHGRVLLGPAIARWEARSPTYPATTRATTCRLWLSSMSNDLSEYGQLPTERALALQPAGKPLVPMAMVCADGVGTATGTRTPVRPMGMVINELIPMCQHLGLGSGKSRIVATGISMGGYGLVTELYPHIFRAVATISPAIRNTWSWGDSANPTAYTSPADFAAYDVVTHTATLAGKPVRVATRAEDPLHFGVVAFVDALAKGAVVVFPRGPIRTPSSPHKRRRRSFSSDYLGTDARACV